MKVIIASQNPTKINAVQLAFQTMFPDQTFDFEGIQAPSGVRDQPIGTEETMLGAMKRAEHAKNNHEGDFWVGIEGGIEKKDGEMGVFAWIVVKSKDKLGKAKTGTFYLPTKVVDLVEAGKELGEADDIVFGMADSKKSNGAVGILTGDIINRTQYYKEAVILSLIPFKNQDLY